MKLTGKTKILGAVILTGIIVALFLNSDEEFLPFLRYQHIEPWHTTRTELSFDVLDFPDSTFRYTVFKCSYQSRRMKSWLGEETSRVRILDGIFPVGAEPYTISYDTTLLTISKGRVTPKRTGTADVLLRTPESSYTTRLLITKRASGLFVQKEGS